MKITQKLLHELFTYDGLHLIRKVNRGPAKAGDIAGCLEPKSGYWRIFLCGRSNGAHRLIWLYVHGEWPNIIDHINRVRHDNRIENLRDVDYYVNARNRCATQRSTTGIMGVSLRRGRYRASIGLNGKTLVLGTFDTIEESTHARRQGELWHWGGTDRSVTLQ